MKTKNYMKYVALGSVLFIIQSCYFDKAEELYPNSSCNTSSVTYANDVSKIINAKCASAGCHVVGAQLPDLSDFNKVKSSVDRVKARAIIDRTMPPGAPLTPCEIDKLNKWINDGAQNN